MLSTRSPQEIENYPFTPFLTAFSMTGGAEAASLAGKRNSYSFRSDPDLVETKQ